MFLVQLPKYFVFVLFAIETTKGGTLSHSLLEKFNDSNNKTDVIIEFPSITKEVLNNPTLNLLRGSDRSFFVRSHLQELTTDSQASTMSAIERLGLKEKAQQFYITNVIYLKNVTKSEVLTLAGVPENFVIREPILVETDKEIGSVREQVVTKLRLTDNSSVFDSVAWGVSRIGAPEVWDKYELTGEGVLVASIDTGVNVFHEAIRENFAGGWYDAVGEHHQPYDDHGHGTAVVGIMAGKKGGMGVAPGSTWIACKGLDSSGIGKEPCMLACGQWILEQDPLPRVVCNSWGHRDNGSRRYFDDVIASWVALDIIPVFGLGNFGPKCESALYPGHHHGVIGVGATDMDDTIASFSSRGPGPHSRFHRPDISAPGVNILSPSHLYDEGYVTRKGTSMAAPHVAGAIALMMQANSSMSFEDIRLSIATSADKKHISLSALKCELWNKQSTYPNNYYGNGRINILKAIEGLKSATKN